MLFDATRRNPTVLYVTQRQNGLMIEGHREIMGAQDEKKSNRDSSSKSGVVGIRATDNRDFDDNEDYKQIIEHAAEQETAILRKHPLRIDIRDNNPEQVIAERLLEATEYTLATTKSVKNMSGMIDEDAHHNDQQRLNQINQSNQMSSFSSRQRPHSASNLSTAHRPPRTHHQISVPTRPSSSNGIPARGVSGAGILNIKSKKVKRFDEDEEGDVDDDDDDEDILALGLGDEDNDQTSYLRNKVTEKKNERLEGARGAGVGSLLDTEIRKIQTQSGDILSGSLNPATTSHNQKIIPKKLKRKVIVSNGLVKRSQPPGVGGGGAPGGSSIPGSGKKKVAPAMTIPEKKQEMKGVYVTPVIRPINKPNVKGSTGKNMEAKGGFVERKRVGITSANNSHNPQRLSLSKSAPTIQRPQSASNVTALRGTVTLGASGSGPGLGMGLSNPYTQRALNPGILF